MFLSAGQLHACKLILCVKDTLLVMLVDGVTRVVDGHRGSEGWVLFRFNTSAQ